MKSKELFMLIDQIDKRFVEEAWEGDEEDGKVIEVVLERSPFHAIKFAVAVAACIVLFGAGFFTIAKIRTGYQFLPDNSGAAESINHSSETESSDSTVSENSDTSSEDEAQSNISNVEGEISDIYEFVKKGKYTMDYHLPYGTELVSEIVEKDDNYDYAVIYVDETNATEEHPIIALINQVDLDGKILDTVSEELQITGRGRYGLYYNRPYGAGTLNQLAVINLYDEELSLKGEELRLVGTWIP